MPFWLSVQSKLAYGVYKTVPKWLTFTVIGVGGIALALWWFLFRSPHQTFVNAARKGRNYPSHAIPYHTIPCHADNLRRTKEI
jgi:hypothetical protein